MAVFAEPGEFTERVLEVVEAIPPGRVMTYGDVAWTFGRPGARAVGMVMRYHGSGLPWWRGLRGGGAPPGRDQGEGPGRHLACLLIVRRVRRGRPPARRRSPPPLAPPRTP